MAQREPFSSLFQIFRYCTFPRTTPCTSLVKCIVLLNNEVLSLLLKVFYFCFFPDKRRRSSWKKIRERVHLNQILYDVTQECRLWCFFRFGNPIAVTLVLERACSLIRKLINWNNYKFLVKHYWMQGLSNFDLYKYTYYTIRTKKFAFHRWQIQHRFCNVFSGRILIRSKDGTLCC